MNYKHTDKAIAFAHTRCCDHKRERKWLEGGPIPDSYENDQYNVKVRVLEGSPPRAILLITEGWSMLVFWDGYRKTFRDRLPTR